MTFGQDFPGDFIWLELVPRRDLSIYRKTCENGSTAEFVVKTSVGVELDAKLSNGEVEYSNGGLRCFVGRLVLDGTDVGRGAVFVHPETDISYCCFCSSDPRFF